MLWVPRQIERFLRVVEGIATALTMGLAILVFVNVLLRYVFGMSAMAVQELQWYFHAFGFLLAMAPALWIDRHVRIDTFYARFPTSWQRWVNVGGTFFFLLPFAGLVIWASYDFVAYSFSIREASPNPGGLPALFVFKAVLPLSFFLLVLAAIGLLWRWLSNLDEDSGRKEGGL